MKTCEAIYLVADAKRFTQRESSPRVATSESPTCK